MSKFQDLYKEQREWKGSSNRQNRKSCFNFARRERRTRNFDAFRGDFGAHNETAEIKPIPKFTFRDTISKLFREKKKKVVTKPRPFVVGTVKHKIYSPPFLHQPLSKIKESKNRLITPLQHYKSFAPANYKFRAPKGLRLELMTPLAEENMNSSPFKLNTVWNKLTYEDVQQQDIHSNITLRSHRKRFGCFDSLSSSACDKEKALKDSENDDHSTNARKELWPEDEDETLVFGRMNIYKREQLRNSLTKENERGGNNLSQNNTNDKDLPNSSFASSNEQIERLKLGNLLESTNLQSESTKSVDANTCRSSSEFRQSSLGKEQIEDLCDTPLQKSTEGMVISYASTPRYNDSFERTIHAEPSPNAERVSAGTAPLTPIEKSPCDKTQDQVNEFSPAHEDQTTDSINVNDTLVGKHSFIHHDGRLIGNEKSNTVDKEDEEIQLSLEKSSEDNNVGELPRGHENSRIESCNSITSSKEKSAIAYHGSRVEDGLNTDRICDSPKEKSAIAHHDSRVEDSLNTDRIFDSPKEKSAIAHHDSRVEDSLNTDRICDSPKEKSSIAHHDSRVEDSLNTDSICDSPKEKSAIAHHDSRVEDSVNTDRICDGKAEPIPTNKSLCSKTLTQEDLDNEVSPSHENKRTDDANLNSSSEEESLNNHQDPRAKNSERLIAENEESSESDGNEGLPGLEDERIERKKSNINLIEKSPINFNNSQAENNDSLVEDGLDERNNQVAMVGDKQVGSAALNSTYTKYSMLIEEEEEDEEELELNLDKSELEIEKEDNTDSPSLHESNVGAKHLDRSKHKLSSIDDMPTSSNTCSEIDNDSDKIQEDCTDQTINAFSNIVVNSPKSLAQLINQFENSSTFTLNPTYFDKDESLNSPSTVVMASQTNVPSRSEAQESEEPKETSESISNTIEDHLNKVDCTNSASRGDKHVSSNILWTRTSNHKNNNNENASLESIDNDNLTDHFQCQMHTCTSSRLGKANDAASKTKQSLDSSGIRKSVSKSLSIKIDSPCDVLSTLSEETTALKTPVQAETNEKEAHAGHVPTRVSPRVVSVISLTDSPVDLSNLSTKPELRKSILDHKSPSLLSKQKHNSLLTDSNEVVDLTSDNEEEFSSLVDRIIKTYGRNSNSPVQSPRNRSPLASIGNTLRMSVSLSKTPQSPLISRISTTVKKTPVKENIPILLVDSPSDCMKDLLGVPNLSKAEVLEYQVLKNTPRKTPRRRKVAKEIATEAQEAPSPIRVMSLRTRNISVSPSPKKMSTRVVTPRATPVIPKVMNQVVAEEIVDQNHLRVMNLRSRNISVSPSPNKMTPRGRKKHNQRV